MGFTSLSLFSLPFILSLPAPFKITLIMLGGFAAFGVRTVDVKQEAVRARAVEVAPVAPANAAPELVAPKVAAKPVKPAEPAKPVAPVIVTMDINGELTLDGRKVGERALVSKLSALSGVHAAQKVILSADANVPAQQVSRIVDLCKSAGISKVTFIAKVAVPTAEDPDSP